MPRMSKSRDVISFIFSAALHVGVAAALITIPAEVRKKYDIVDMTVQQRKPLKPPEPEMEEEVREEPEPEPEKQKPAVRKKVEKAEPEPPPPPPEEAPPPDKAEEAPPVFDLGDNTFATGNGQGAGWQLGRSEGNTKFAGVAGKKQPPVRGTKPKAAPRGKPGGTGKEAVSAPVPLRDLSKRPEPRGGPPPAPPYPLEARKAGIEGPVVLQVFIDKTGKVKKTRVIKSPSDTLAQAAQTAIGKVLWTPPLDKSGKPVDTVIVWTYRYVLDG